MTATHRVGPDAEEFQASLPLHPGLAFLGSRRSAREVRGERVRSAPWGEREREREHERKAWEVRVCKKAVKEFLKLPGASDQGFKKGG